MAPSDTPVSADNIAETLHGVLKLAAGQKPGRDVDFFSLGLDSRGIVDFLAALRAGHAVFKTVPWRAIYEHPTPRSLAAHVNDGQRFAGKSVQQLVDEYSTFTDHQPSEARGGNDGEYCIVVTGPTGSLGAHIVAQLVADERVHKVYCFVRASSRTASTATQRMARALKPHHLAARDTAKIVAYSTNLAWKGFGLTAAELTEVRENANVVIHAAWAVNYNMQLSSFEHLVKSTRNLIDLCLQARRPAPAAFNFVSSTAVSPGDALPEAYVDSAGPTGYAQSKFVAEQLCKRASSKLPVRVLRLGSLVGDTVKGRWNTAEPVPVVVKYSAFSHRFPMPKEDEMVFWLPVDVAARACAHLALLPPQDGLVCNVSNPKSISWNREFFPALQAAGLDMKLVPQHEWFEKFQRWGHELGEYIGRQYAVDDTADDHVVKTPVHVVTANTEKLYPELGSKVVDRAMVKLFVEFWEKQEGWGGPMHSRRE